MPGSQKEARPLIPAIRTIIADDEGLARKALRMLLSAEYGVNVVSECQTGEQTISAVKDHRPDLLFLNIQLPDCEGLKVLDEIPPDRMPFVVFTAPSNHHAIRAFEARGLDYLLKPFDEERVHRSVQEARNELLKCYEQSVKTRIIELLSEASPKSKPLRRLVIRSGGRVLFLDINEIDWIEAAANYVKLHVGKDTFLLREGIGRLATKLDPERFVRIHRSSIVNVNRIRELQPCESGEYIAVLKDGKALSCSRGCRPHLLRLIEGGI
jgi:two-component system LytT family response regulator